ncbi:MAG TPA: histidine kinase dimerization/phospho-acceptor domain-containing protein [Bacteroidaceae bacterium]|nr:histidine kinase dimerization/phospho-acceptor domain-containing protein [Bacteroidaceae bacterium]
MNIQGHYMYSIGFFLLVLLSVVCVATLIVMCVRVHRQIRTTRDNIQEAIQKVEKANQAKSIFIRAFDHTIRTPLNAVFGFSSILSHEEISPKDKRSYAAILNDSAISVLSSITDILDMSRLESGLLPMAGGAQELSVLLTTWLKDIERVYKDKCSIRYPEHIPTVHIATDLARFKELFYSVYTYTGANVKQLLPESSHGRPYISLSVTYIESRGVVVLRFIGSPLAYDDTEQVYHDMMIRNHINELVLKYFKGDYLMYPSQDITQGMIEIHYPVYSSKQVNE